MVGYNSNNGVSDCYMDQGGSKHLASSKSVKKEQKPKVISNAGMRAYYNAPHISMSYNEANKITVNYSKDINAEVKVYNTNRGFYFEKTHGYTNGESGWGYYQNDRGHEYVHVGQYFHLGASYNEDLGEYGAYLWESRMLKRIDPSASQAYEMVANRYLSGWNSFFNNQYAYIQYESYGLRYSF